MFRSLRTRLFLTHLLVGGLVLSLLGASFLLLIANNPTADQIIYERLATIGNVLIAQERLRAAQQDRIQLVRLMSILGRAVEAQAYVYDAELAQVFGTTNDSTGPPLDAIESARGGESARGRYQDAQGISWLFVVRPLPDARTLVVTAPRPNVRTLVGLLGEAIAPLAQAALVAFVASLLLALLLARWVAGPLRRLAAASRSIARGEDDVHMDPGGPTEVTAVWGAFAEMVGKMRASQQALQDFVANVSHELKTPLTSIQGFAQAIVDGTAQAEEGRRAATVIYDEAQRMRRMVDDLLDLARFDAGEAALARLPIQPRELIAQVVDRLQPGANEKSIGLVTELADLPPIVGDSDRLAQVFINLLSNAIEHTPTGGNVEVRGAQAGGWIEVAVSDTGPGIPPDELSRIFERFYQVDRARAGGGDHGAGLGLAIAREIVRAHGGTLTAESQLGAGSTFRVRLPTSKPTDSTIAGDIIRRS